MKIFIWLDVAYQTDYIIFWSKLIIPFQNFAVFILKKIHNIILLLNDTLPISNSSIILKLRCINQKLYRF